MKKAIKKLASSALVFLMAFALVVPMSAGTFAPEPSYADMINFLLEAEPVQNDDVQAVSIMGDYFAPEPSYADMINFLLEAEPVQNDEFESYSMEISGIQPLSSVGHTTAWQWFAVYRFSSDAEGTAASFRASGPTLVSRIIGTFLYQGWVNNEARVVSIRLADGTTGFEVQVRLNGTLNRIGEVHR